eukprot:scaffold379149_cov47-Attheya_sp.AAC.1
MEGKEAGDDLRLRCVVPDRGGDQVKQHWRRYGRCRRSPWVASQGKTFGGHPLLLQQFILQQRII